MYLIDSISKDFRGASYRNKFANNLPELFLHVFKATEGQERIQLCKMRQTWNGVFNYVALRRLDEKIQRIDSSWPNGFVKKQLRAEVKKVDEQLAAMCEEIKILEQQHPEFISNRIETAKRKKIKHTFDEVQSKKRAFASIVQNRPLNIETHVNILSSSSSVLLTPSPGPRDNSNEQDFWLKMSEMSDKKSNSPVLIDENDDLPFLFDSNSRNSDDIAADIMNFCEKEVLDCSNMHEYSQSKNCATQISKTTSPRKNDTSDEDETPTSDEDNAPTPNKETDFELIEPKIAVINLDKYEEKACTVPITAVIKTEPKTVGYSDDDGFIEDLSHHFNDSNEEDSEQQGNILTDPETSPESHHTSESTFLAMDGNIEFTPIARMPSKKIKINFLSVFEEQRHVLEEQTEETAKIICKQLVQNKSDKYETPVLSYKLKDSMKNIIFLEQRILRRGSEKSGMCSIM